MMPREQAQLERLRDIARSATGTIWMFYILMISAASMILGPALAGPLPIVPSLVLFITGVASLVILFFAARQMRILRRDALERIAELTQNGASQ